MKSGNRALFVMIIAGFMVAGAGFSVAQAGTHKPTSNGVAQQFKSGADRVGQGAAQIGEGIKQGAIMTWQAMKAGANAAAAKFNGNGGSRTSHKGRAASTRQPR